jgi:hypothetical protein
MSASISTSFSSEIDASSGCADADLKVGTTTVALPEGRPEGRHYGQRDYGCGTG